MSNKKMLLQPGFSNVLDQVHNVVPLSTPVDVCSIKTAPSASKSFLSCHIRCLPGSAHSLWDSQKLYDLEFCQRSLDSGVCKATLSHWWVHPCIRNDHMGDNSWNLLPGILGVPVVCPHLHLVLPDYPRYTLALTAWPSYSVESWKGSIQICTLSRSVLWGLTLLSQLSYTNGWKILFKNRFLYYLQGTQSKQGQVSWSAPKKSILHLISPNKPPRLLYEQDIPLLDTEIICPSI